MVLFREVYGWLRHLLKTDLDTVACGVVVQEIASMSASENDRNDGSRTLAIHQKEVGLIPRIEVRFVGLHPQIVWVDGPDFMVIHQSNQYGFPGDWFSYDVSDLCECLLKIAKEKFCTGKVVVVVEKAQASATNFKLMPADFVIRVLDSLKAKVSKKITRQALNKWLSAQDESLTKGGNSFDFAHSVIHHFKKETLGKGPKGSRKVDSEDLDLLEDKFDPGHPLVEWSAMKRWLAEPDVRGKLPPKMLERVVSSTAHQDDFSQNKARSRMEGWLANYIHGRDLDAAECGAVGLGQGIIAAFKSGLIPITYLSQAELADPFEKLMPWSMIRRAVLSYKITAGKDEDELVDLILEWLEGSDLLLPLYQQDEAQAEALKKALRAQIEHYMDFTVKNPAWIREVLDGYVGMLPQADIVRSIQIDFDLWLFNALSPAVQEKDLPLSPYAFSIDRKDQQIYEKMIGAWLVAFKDFLKTNQETFVEWLTMQLEGFYAHVKALWGKSGMSDYKPKMPSVSRILEAVKTGDKEALLSLIVEDLEAEAGTGVPDIIKMELLVNPFFNSIYDAVRLQSVQLP